MPTSALVPGLLFLGLYAAFWLWYGGRGRPLTAAEVEAGLAEIQRRAGKAPGAEDGVLLPALRALAASDDGREFYMLNLLKFRQRAAYPAGSPYGADPLAANDRYNRAVLPLLIKYGGHPVFLSQVQGRFLHPSAADDWDQAALVRYRSRRDLLRMAADLAGQGGDQHKWAALEKTQVFPVRPILHLAFVRAGVAMVLIMLALLARQIWF